MGLCIPSASAIVPVGFCVVQLAFFFKFVALAYCGHMYYYK